jgi:hypothetical protein
MKLSAKAEELAATRKQSRIKDFFKEHLAKKLVAYIDGFRCSSCIAAKEPFRDGDSVDG